MAKIIQVSILFAARVSTVHNQGQGDGLKITQRPPRAVYYQPWIWRAQASCSNLAPSDPWGKKASSSAFLHSWVQMLLLASPVSILPLTTTHFGLKQFNSHLTNVISWSLPSHHNCPVPGNQTQAFSIQTPPMIPIILASLTNPEIVRSLCSAHKAHMAPHSMLAMTSTCPIHCQSSLCLMTVTVPVTSHNRLPQPCVFAAAFPGHPV